MRTILSILCLWCLAVPAWATTVRLKPTITIEGSLVTLGDIAELSEADEATLERYRNVTVSPAPAAGRETRITIDTLRRELALRGIDQTRLQFTGSTETVVSRAAEPQPVAAPVSTRANPRVLSNISDAISSYITRTGQIAGPLQVAIHESSQSTCPPELTVHSTLSVAGGQSPFTGMQQFTIGFTQADGTLSQFAVSCTVSQKPQVLALKHGLPRGQVIRDVDLMWIEAESATAGFADPAEVVGTETTRTVRAMLPIKPEDVRLLPLVRRNDIVAVTANVGSISVKRYCKALEEGTMGQFISLSPVDSTERITARVSGYREAMISMDSRPNPASHNVPQPAMTPAPVAPSSGLQLILHEERNAAPKRVAPSHRIEVRSNPQRPASSPSSSPRVLANQPAVLP
ncbi:flagellar basal body P-ring formation chaperone FlgA [Rubinisphaera margarita]|uniref:flagellar basal body P-ring formation chaperone FlgA n=1 Tax=Rubinisphaera margarita TaxID=2909586 RepID=UPI001EE903BF|nr:flagellar basal body P-ring formation chaperone FlgA [Rubinisphaera margarita]MCG6156862.1 flagellar basal body P-ring formation chaperone FlgA [Rubinisphaera margarita]